MVTARRAGDYGAETGRAVGAGSDPAVERALVAGDASAAPEVALLDRDGLIVSTNQAWRDFASDNGGDPHRTGVGVSYFEASKGSRDPWTMRILAALTRAAAGHLPIPVLTTIPCDAPDRPRTFDVWVSSRLADDGTCLGLTVALTRRAGPQDPPEASQPPGGRPPRALAGELVGVSIGLRGLARRVTDPEARSQVAGYAQDTEGLARRLGAAAFRPFGAVVVAELKQRVLEAFNEAQRRSDLRGKVHFSGSVDGVVPEDLADDVVAVVREGLGHAQRRSGTTNVVLAVAIGADELALDLVDDGLGRPAHPGQIATLRRLALRHGGDVEVSRGTRRGTYLRWTASIRA